MKKKTPVQTFDESDPQSSYKVVWTKVDSQGRVVIPAEIREAAGIELEKSLAFVLEGDGSVSLMTVRQGVARAQARIREDLNLEPGRSYVDEFIAERRAEAARE